MSRVRQFNVTSHLLISLPWHLTLSINFDARITTLGSPHSAAMVCWGGEEGVSSCSKRHALNVTTISMQGIAYIYVL
jgi:hypothetical protein